MLIESIWNSINEFLKNIPSIFWAIVFAMLVQRIADELGKMSIDIIPRKPNPLIRMCNYFIRLVLAFVIGLAFIYIFFIILSFFSALIKPAFRAISRTSRFKYFPNGNKVLESCA